MAYLEKMSEGIPSLAFPTVISGLKYFKTKFS